MYNQIVKKMLAEISKNDGDIYPNQDKYRVSDDFSTIEIYIGEKRVSFKVLGDAYIVAMTKWLQVKLQSKENSQEISFQNLVEIFDLPKVKYRNAIQIVELIEKINER